MTKDIEAKALIKEEYLRNDIPWFIGYSGGKDSSALLKLVYSSLKELKNFHKDVTIVYCDTGVENPIITQHVYATLERLKLEINENQLPIKIRIAEPNLDDRFFVKVIGRGYPPPTNIFRWCTDKMRINPVKKIVDSNSKSIILLGVRKGESEQRDRTISKHKSKDNYFLNQNGSTKNIIFSPIIEHSLKDIWQTLKYIEYPKAIDFVTLGELYKDAGSECPVYRELPGQSCGGSRFGCWTCTVVRKDKSISNMIENGYSELKNLYEFRNWISVFRDNKDYRCERRRNGQKGLGPITLEGRKIILDKLIELQSNTHFELIKEIEISRIKEFWKMDEDSVKYFEKTAYNKSICKSRA